MKILVATGAYPPDIGGPATYSELLFRELPKTGIEVEILSFGGVRHLPKVVRHVVFFVKIIWHGRASDVIFAQDTVSVGLPSLAAAFILGKPFIVRVPGDHAWEQAVQRYGVNDSIDEFQTKKYGSKVEFLRRIQKLVVNKADKVVAPSRYFAGLVRGWLKDPEKVLHIYNGVDLERIKNIDRQTSYTPKTIISAGRLVPWKGFDMLIRAMRQLPGWKLEIAGDGPEMENLASLIARENLGDKVSLVGRIDKKELFRKIANSEIFALNTFFESFSFQVVEAMAIGTPVIATKVGNLAEIIDDGKNGLLIEPDNEKQFLQAVNRLTADRNFRNKIVEAEKRKASEFSIASTVEKIKTVLVSLCDAPIESRKRKILTAKILRYILSGGTAAFTDLVLLYIFKDLFGIWYLISSVLAFLVAFVVSFILQKFFTFQDHGRDGMQGQAAVYLAVTGTNLVINTALIYVFVQYTGLHYIRAQIATSILIAIESFIIYGMFIFNKKPGHESPRP